MKRVCVTGGAGFIGTHLVNLLNLKSDISDILVIDNLTKGRNSFVSDKVNVLKLDILQDAKLVSTIADFKPTDFYHLAAEHYIPVCEKDPFRCFDINVVGTLNVLEAIRSSNSVDKFFFASTGDVYAPTNMPHQEVDDTSPIYTYGESKLIGERLVRRYAKFSEFPDDVIIGRLFNAVGKHETNPHFLPAILKQIKSGADVVEVGNVWPERDFVDVSMLAKCINKLLESSNGIDIVNVGSGQAISIGSVLEIIQRVSPSNVVFKSVPERQRPNDRPFLCPDVSKLVRLIGHAAAPLDEDTIRSILNAASEESFYYA